MTPGSRQNLLVAAAAQLQGAYARRSAAQRAAAEELARVDPYRAPAHLVPGLQAELDLGVRAPLQADQVRAEAA